MVSLLIGFYGDQLDVFSATGARFLLIFGAPFGEPIAPYGPFVMNTQEEIRQAFMELRNGTFIKKGEKRDPQSGNRSTSAQKVHPQVQA
jgi:hypothetical protein